MLLKLEQWASAPPAGYPGAIAIPSGKQAEGWKNGEEPPAPYINQAFQAVADAQQELTTAITGTGGTLADDLTQLLATLQRQQLKAALQGLKKADDTGASVTLRALAVDPTNRVAVVVGDDATIQYASLLTSFNFGAATPDASFTGDFTDILWDSFFHFVAVGEGGEIQTSTTGATWTMQNTTGGNLRAVASSGSVLIAVGASGTIMRSVSGGGWTTPSHPFAGSPDICAVAWGAGRFVIVTTKGDIASSTTGTSWTVHQALAGTVRDPSRLAYHSTLGFIYHYGNDVYRSADGVTWTKIVNEIGIPSQTHAPGLLVSPYAWVLGWGAADGVGCEARYVVTGTSSAAFTLSYMLDEPLTWWKILGGQLWALGGDKVFVGGAI